MNHKFTYLIKHSLNRKLKSKWFLIANLILAIAIIGLININSLITFFGGDFNQPQNLMIVDNTGEAYDLFVTNLNTIDSTIYENHSFNITQIDTYSKTLDTKNWYLIFNYEDGMLSAELITEETIDSVPYQELVSAINSTKVSLAMAHSSIDQTELALINEDAKIKRTILNETPSTNEATSMIMSTVFPIIILPFFMLTIYLIQMIGAEINEEKASRGMEIIISSVSPTIHFFSKVIAGMAFVLLQAFMIVIYSAIGLLIRSCLATNLSSDLVSSTINTITTSNLINSLCYVLPIILFLMIITQVAYALLAGILASMTTNIEDFQQMQTPIMIISLIGYYLAIMAGVFKGSIFIRIISYLPFISAILSPSLLVLGYISWYDIVISIIIVLLTIYLLIKYGLKIYKVGILNYTSKDLWKKLFKAMQKE